MLFIFTNYTQSNYRNLQFSSFKFISISIHFSHVFMKVQIINHFFGLWSIIFSLFWVVRKRFKKTMFEETATSKHSINGTMSTTCYLMSTHLSPGATIVYKNISHWTCQRIGDITFKPTSIYTQELNKTPMEA